MDGKATEAGSTAEANIHTSPSKASVEQFLEQESKSTDEVNTSVQEKEQTEVFRRAHLLEDNNKMVAMELDNVNHIAAPLIPENNSVVKSQQECDEGFDDEDVNIAAFDRHIQDLAKGVHDLDGTDGRLNSSPKDLDPTTSPIRISDGQSRKLPDSEAQNDSIPQVGDKSSKSDIPEIITILPDSPKSFCSDTELENNEIACDEGRLDGKTGKDKDEANVEDNVTANVENGHEKPLSFENKDEILLNVENEEKPVGFESKDVKQLNVENRKEKPLNVENKEEIPLNVDNKEEKLLNVENNKEIPINVENKEEKPLNATNDKIIDFHSVEVKAESRLDSENSGDENTFNSKIVKEEGELNIDKEEGEFKTDKKEDEVGDTTKYKEDVPKPLDNAKDNQSPSDSVESASDTWMDILGSGHLLKRVIKPGIPNTRPNKSDICILDYRGWLEDGTVVDEADHLKIQLNDNEVIQGIDFALALMDKGEEAELKVSSRFAYGVLGREPDIPSGSTLTYNIKLLDVQDEPIIHSLSLEERVTYGLQKKQRGNFWYAREDHSLAIDCYRRALEYLDDTAASEPQDVVNMQKLLEERLKTYNNLAASQLRVSAFDAALMSVNNVLNAQPKNVKALYRKAKILREKGDVNMAMKTIRTALSYEPDLKILQRELSSLLAEDRKIFSREKELYKKMLGNNPNQEKEDEKKSSSNHYNTLKWFTIISFAVAVIGTIAFKYSK